MLQILSLCHVLDSGLPITVVFLPHFKLSLVDWFFCVCVFLFVADFVFCFCMVQLWLHYLRD